MQKTNSRLVSGYRIYPDIGTPTERNKPRSQQYKTDNKTVRRSTNDFLTAVFKPIHNSEMNPSYSKTSYMYLYDSAKNYANLLGANLRLKPNFWKFEKLYNTFRKLLPCNQDLSLQVRKNRLEFVVTENYDEHTLYYTPCCIIDSTGDKWLKDIYTSFFSLFQKTQGLTSLKQDVIMDYYQEEMEYKEKEEDEDNSDDEWHCILSDYFNGPISKVFDAVNAKPEYDLQELQQQIISYKSKIKEESIILDLMQEGLVLFEKDSIMHYARPPIENDEENYPVEMYRMMYLVYDDDLVFENLFEWVSNEANDQGYEILSSTCIRLSTETKNTLKHSEYIGLFLNWLNRFNYELRNL